MFCKNCGAEIAEGAVVCMTCGFAVGTGEHYCGNCGVAVEPGQAVCVSCGAALIGDGSTLGKSTKSKIIAGILGILLGALGIHNFYLGKTKRALIQLLVTLLTCGIGGVAMEIWGFIEGIFYLVGYNGYTTDSEGKTLIE